MNWDQIEGKWKQIKGEVSSRWNRLTGDDIEAIEGDGEKLVGKIQERYGVAKEEAREQVDAWMRDR